MELEGTVHNGGVVVESGSPLPEGTKVRVVVPANSAVQPKAGLDGVTDPAWPRFPKAGSCKGMIWMADDFDAPLEELREYME